MVFSVKFDNLEKEFNFSEKDIYAIQAKNGLCKSLIFNLLNNNVLNNMNASDEINKISVSINEYNESYKPIFYSYIDKLMNNINVIDEVYRLFSSKELIQKLLIPEFEKIKNKKRVKNFKESMEFFFEYDFTNFENINFVNNHRSSCETFLNNLLKINSDEFEIDKIIPTIDIIFYANVNEIIRFYNELSLTETDELIELLEDLKKDFNILSNHMSLDDHNHQTFLEIKKSLEDKLLNKKQAIINYISQNYHTYSHFLNNFYTRILNILLEDVEIIDFEYLEILIEKIRTFSITFASLKIMYDNVNDIKRIIEKIVVNRKIIEDFIDELDYFLKEYNKTFKRSMLNKIEDGFFNIFGKNIEIKRHKILDFIFKEKISNSIESVLSIYIDGKKIEQDHNWLSDGYKNILFFLYFYINTMISDNKNIFIFDDVSIGLDKSNQLSLIELIIFFLEKGHKFFILSHDSYFIKNLKTAINLHKSKKSDFTKIEKIYDKYYILDFDLLDTQDIIKNKIDNIENLPLKISCFRESVLSTGIWEKKYAKNRTNNDDIHLETTFKKIFNSLDENLSLLKYDEFNFMNIKINNINEMTWNILLDKYVCNDTNFNINLFQEIDIKKLSQIFNLKFNLVFLSRLMYKKIFNLNSKCNIHGMGIKNDIKFLDSYMLNEFIHNSYTDFNFFVDYEFEIIVKVFNRLLDSYIKISTEVDNE